MFAVVVPVSGPMSGPVAEDRRGSISELFSMNDDSRPSSPNAPPQDLWSSILNSVSSSRSIPAKNVLVLGQPSTGKSTLVSALLQKPPADAGKDEPRTDYALGYDWADIRDEGEEGLLSTERNPHLLTRHIQISLPAYPCTPSHHRLLHTRPSYRISCSHNPLFHILPL